MLAMYIFVVATIFGLWVQAMAFILTKRPTVDGRMVVTAVLWSVLAIIALIYVHFNLAR